MFCYHNALFCVPCLHGKTPCVRIIVAPTVVYPQGNGPTALTVDASDHSCGTVLEQLIDNMWQPLGFFSKQFPPPELKYSTFDRELLALYLAVRHLWYFLEATTFATYTDHKPLTLAFSKITEPWSPTQQLHLATISEFTACIRCAFPVETSHIRVFPADPNGTS